MNNLLSVLSRSSAYLPLKLWKFHRKVTLSDSPFLVFYKPALLLALLFFLLQTMWILARNQRYGILFASSRHASRLFGLMMEIPIPFILRPLVLGLFAKVYKIDLSELKQELCGFKTMKEFFIRELKEGARPQCNAELQHGITSPCDGVILKAEQLKKGGLLEPVKGRPYSMRQFLFGNYADDRKAQLFIQQVKSLLEEEQPEKPKTKLMYSVIYLSPKNYHRFHAPTNLSISSRRHIEGYLETVKPSYMKKHPYVLKSNERVTLFGRWDHGHFMMSPVGALNVGSIHLLFEPWLTTNSFQPYTAYCKDFSYVDSSNQACFLKAQKKLFHFSQKQKDAAGGSGYLLSENGLEVERGQALGYFNFGSTLVMVFETKQEWEFTVEEGQEIKMGEVLGSL